MPRCPLCKTRCGRIRYEGVSIYSCGSCGGHWLREVRLDVIMHRRDYQMPDAVKRKMIEIAEASDTAETLTCMTCGKPMVKEQFKHWPEIQIDRCPKCNGIWLDRGELEKCQIYWEYMQDHPDAERTDTIARRAMLDAELQERQAELRRQREQAETASRLRGYGVYGGSAGSSGFAGVLRSLFGR